MSEARIVRAPQDMPELAIVQEDGEGGVTLKLPRAKFAELLVGFLGAKETLKKSYEVDYIARLHDLLQFHYLLTQKLEKEEFISISFVTASFHYDDDTQRTLNSFEAIERYSEHRDVGVVSLEMSWSFAFRVPADGTIQQQKVELLCQTIGSSSKRGLITVTIESTNQLWAAEVLRLFEQQISKIAYTYAVVYTALAVLRRPKIFEWLAMVCFMIAGGAGIYMFNEAKNLTHPLKVGDEFIFDIANVLTEHAESLDASLYLQFFLIRDIANQPRSVIDALNKKGYFDKRYQPAIEKLASGYYASEAPSARLSWNTETLMRELQAKSEMRRVWWYLRYALIYLVAYTACGCYLLLFRVRSILALTSKGERAVKKQSDTKSIAAQLCFGTLASLIAAAIWTYGLQFFF